MGIDVRCRSIPVIFSIILFLIISMQYVLGIFKRHRDIRKPLAHNISLDPVHGNFSSPESESNNIVYSTALEYLLSSVIDPYLSWHVETRRKCEKYKIYCRFIKLLVYRGSTWNFGIGDRVRGALNAFLIAAVTKRLILIDLPEPYPIELAWESPTGINFTYDPLKFPLPKNETTPFSFALVNENTHPGDLYRYRTKKRVVLHRGMAVFSPNDVLKFASEISEPGKEHIFSKFGNLSYSTDAVAHILLQRLFRESRELSNLISKSKPFQQGTYYSLHARMGIGVGEIDSRFNVSALNTTYESMAYCIGTVSASKSIAHKISQIYVSTDSRAFHSSFTNGIKSVLPNATVRFASGEALHLRKMKSKTDGNLSGFYQSFVDIAHLSKGKGIVYFPSGFADVAIWVGGLKLKQSVSFQECTNLMSLRFGRPNFTVGTLR